MKIIKKTNDLLSLNTPDLLMICSIIFKYFTKTIYYIKNIIIYVLKII